MPIKQYWSIVHTRTLALARKAAGLESRDRMITAIIVQVLIAGLILSILRENDLWVRLISAISPFLLIPGWYIAKFPSVPAILAKEADDAKAAELAVVCAELDSAKATIEELNERLNARKQRALAARKLATLLRQVDTLRATSVKNDDQYKTFSIRLSTFINEIPNVLEGAVTEAQLIALCSQPPTNMIARGSMYLT